MGSAAEDALIWFHCIDVSCSKMVWLKEAAFSSCCCRLISLQKYRSHIQAASPAGAHSTAVGRLPRYHRRLLHWYCSQLSKMRGGRTPCPPMHPLPHHDPVSSSSLSQQAHYCLLLHVPFPPQWAERQRAQSWKRRHRRLAGPHWSVRSLSYLCAQPLLPTRYEMYKLSLLHNALHKNY